MLKRAGVWITLVGAGVLAIAVATSPVQTSTEFSVLSASPDSTLGASEAAAAQWKPDTTSPTHGLNVGDSLPAVGEYQSGWFEGASPVRDAMPELIAVCGGSDCDVIGGFVERDAIYPTAPPTTVAESSLSFDANGTSINPPLVVYDAHFQPIGRFVNGTVVLGGDTALDLNE
jgi:hypothetical protein